MDDILERLKAGCIGQPAKIPWPHRLLHDAIAEIERLRMFNDWQPIETAPRDGTYIDLFGTRNGQIRRFPNARWSQDCWGGMLFDTYSWSHYGWDVYGDFEYTHWMPIPKPPKVSDA